MAISKERKDKLIDEYVELLNQSEGVFLTEYTGLNVKQMQQLRAEVRKVDGIYKVTKNTLLTLALERAGKPTPPGLLSGQLATGFALNEVPALAKTLIDFAKDEEQLAIKGGILGDALLTSEEIESLASLPSLSELHAQIVGLIQAPARNLVTTVTAGVRQAISVIDAYSKSEGEIETT